MGEAARAAEHAGVDHAGKGDVVDEAGAEYLVGKVDAGKAAADHLEIGRAGERGGAARRPREIDRLRERPVIERGRRAVLEEFAVGEADRGGRAVEAERCGFGEERAHLGGGDADRAARRLDGLAAGREPLLGRGVGVAGDDAHALGLDAQLLGGDLDERGEDALAELDLAGREPDAPARLEADPAVEAGIGGEAGGEGHGASPRIARAARATARIIRFCAPQRQRFFSSASAISARVGFGLRASSALAAMRMPPRQ
jgi:hypothetical protein